VGYNEFTDRRVFLKMIGKCAVLGLFLCAGYLFSEEIPTDEDPFLSEGFFFFEEYFLFGKPFSSEDPFFSEESPPDDEPLLSEESLPDDESLLSEESPSDDESLLSEEFPLDEENLLSEESLPGDESLLSGEALSGDETLLSEETLPDDGSLLSEGSPPVDIPPLSEKPFLDDDYLSEEGFFFEAPPLIFEVPEFVYETRSFDDLFPGFSRGQKRMALSDEGIKNYFEKDDAPALTPHPDSGIDLVSIVMSKKPSHIIEAMVVVPYKERELDILDIYNALRKIRDIQDQTISINDNEYIILEETTRLESAKSRKSIPDPPPVDTLPYSETMYLRFKDAYYGNLYIRGDVSMGLYGIIYNMTNFTDVRYFLIPIIRAERLSIIIYLEPIKEGVLVYSVSGLYLPGFIADRVNLSPSINRRITVLLGWISDSLRKQESIAAKREKEVSVIGHTE
jgi:hypothetical protein